MPVTVYKSTDGSAPVLTGQVNSLVALLDAVLVTGYGAKAAAGWTKPYTGTNKAAFRNHATGSNLYLRVDDAAPNATAAAREAQLRGYEAMTTVDAGTGPYPTTTQMAVSGVPVRKSYTADATARAWIIIADNKTLYLFIKCGDFSGWTGFMFGDFFSLGGSGDLYRSIIIGRSTVASELDDVDNLQRLTYTAILTAGHWVPRTWAGLIQSAATVGKQGDAGKSASAPSLYGNVVYPNKVDGSIMLAPVWIHEDNGSTLVMRGRMRGFWHFLHPAAAGVNDGDTFSGSGALAGKTFLVMRPAADGFGVFVIETSDTWETN